MQRPSVDGRFVIIGCSSPRSALVVTDCVSLAAAFLAANALSVVPPLVKKSRSVRLFACKRALVVTDCASLAAAFLAAMLAPSFLLSSKSLARFGCSLINALTTPRCRYQLFAVSSGRVLCPFLSACRWKTRANDVRTVDG